MKFLHLSDLHLGKRVNEFSMLEDQKYILEEILQIAEVQKPDAVIIAGDIYDKSVPPAEAVQLFDDFLCRLAELKLQVFVISGNHDSSERMAFGARLMDRSGIHISPVYDGKVEPIKMQDEYGTVSIYMLPFIKPAHVRRYFPDEEIESYTDAVRIAARHMQLDTAVRNIIVTHQFVTGASRSDSEEISVGGTDNVDVSVFDDFDYVALGHIHGPQNIGSERVRYCGTPLKYSFSEVNHEKSVTLVEMGEKGKVKVETVPLQPLRDMVQLKGTYMEVSSKAFYESLNTDNYVNVVLTDEEAVPDALGKLRLIYPNIMKLEYQNRRTQLNQEIVGALEVEKKSPLQLFMELYEMQNNQEMSEQQQEFCSALIEKIQEENK